MRGSGKKGRKKSVATFSTRGSETGERNRVERREEGNLKKERRSKEKKRTGNESSIRDRSAISRQR